MATCVGYEARLFVNGQEVGFVNQIRRPYFLEYYPAGWHISAPMAITHIGGACVEGMADEKLSNLIDDTFNPLRQLRWTALATALLREAVRKLVELLGREDQ